MIGHGRVKHMKRFYCTKNTSEPNESGIPADTDEDINRKNGCLPLLCVGTYDAMSLWEHGESAMQNQKSNVSTR